MNHKLFDLVLSIKRRCIATEERIQRENQLTHGEFHGLLVLKPGEEILGNTFSERMVLSASRGSRVLHRMDNSGLVVTRFNPSDRRSVYIALTPKGRTMKRKIEQKLQECEERIFSRLDDDERGRIKDALYMLEKAM